MARRMRNASVVYVCVIAINTEFFRQPFFRSVIVFQVKIEIFCMSMFLQAATITTFTTVDAMRASVTCAKLICVQNIQVETYTKLRERKISCTHITKMWMNGARNESVSEAKSMNDSIHDRSFFACVNECVLVRIYALWNVYYSLATFNCWSFCLSKAMNGWHGNFSKPFVRLCLDNCSIAGNRIVHRE